MGEGAERPRGEISVSRIAELAGVSASTVSKVIHGRTGVSAGTRQRIEELIREHGFRKNEKTRTAPIVEIVFQALDSLWALEIIRGVEQVVRPHGLAVALTEKPDGREPGSLWVRQMLARRPFGVIAVSAEFDDVRPAQLASRGIPLVALDPTGEPSRPVPSVGATNWNGGLVAARHLLELGHRRIAMVNGPDGLLCCRARLDGFRAALDAAGLPHGPELLRTAPLYYEGGRDAAAGLLRLPDRPTAVFAANDLQALGVYEAAHAAGLRVPHDLSVVGFDDLAFSQWSGPPLTTVRQPLMRMGATAAEFLLDLAAGRELRHDRIEVPTELVVRASTAPPPGGPF
ncbi:LacI family DNA-binding transcriptional regulator [Streptomyces xinghaiensis]|uniref:LacI family DNA-binding transcriptional regulator n=1 Tax=Streptomyces xinghaiensis TaxID=1038928 RepID=UPI002E140D41|nr:LacI family DNA-binding transcriptional regulator [Streptomyces xinghaiensis]